MGAEDFTNRVKASSAQEAFRIATEEARYNYGHAGYTGTIAEKSDFVMLKPSPERLEEIKSKGWIPYEPDDPLWEKVDDKWGPAGCIDLKDGTFLFFGWASS
jgi:hypothetical protein